MNVLALEPYYGGSHQAFLETWIAGSRHHWTCLTLPPHHWKWRMRHASVTLAQQAEALWQAGQRWEVVVCSDMLSLAEWKGLAPSMSPLRTIAYFHENQLTYPVQHEDQRDFHFGMSNITTILAADQTWFNSEFHRQEFCRAAESWLKRMPDHAPLVTTDQLLTASMVQSPGCPPVVAREDSPTPGRLRIGWAARWEHDKGPETLCAAIEQLLQKDFDFELSVMGQVFRETPDCLERLRIRLLNQGKLRHWGWQSAAAYEQALRECDVFVSTAEHEFFGLSVLEAIAWGARPLLPQRLSYPELLSQAACPNNFFYDGTAARLAEILKGMPAADHLSIVRDAQQAIHRYEWPRRIAALDNGLEAS